MRTRRPSCSTSISSMSVSWISLRTALISLRSKAPSSGPLHIYAGARVYADQVADIDEQRNLYDRPGLQFGRLRPAGGGVTPDAGLRFAHPDLHEGREENSRRFGTMEQDGHDQPFLEETAGASSLFLVHPELL